MKYDIEFLENYWMLFIVNCDFKVDLCIIVCGEGVYMYILDGEPILDGFFGLFCCVVGYSCLEIVEVVYVQLKEVVYVLLF